MTASMMRGQDLPLYPHFTSRIFEIAIPEFIPPITQKKKIYLFHYFKHYIYIYKLAFHVLVFFYELWYMDKFTWDLKGPDRTLMGRTW